MAPLILRYIERQEHQALKHDGRDMQPQSVKDGCPSHLAFVM